MPLPRFEKLDQPRKDSILAAAVEEFAEHGFAGASYNRIIAGAGISKGAMYYYFADKDDLYSTAMRSALSRWMQVLGFPFDADDAASFWAACETMYARSLRFMLEDPRNAALCFGIVNAKARLEGHPVLLELNERMLELTNVLVERGRAVGAVREDLPRELLVHSALSLMEAGDRWIASRWHEMGEDDVEATAKTMVGLFRRLGEPEVTR